MELIAAGALLAILAVALEVYEHRLQTRYNSCRGLCPICMHGEKNTEGKLICRISGKPVIKTAGTWKCRCWRERRW